MSFLGKLLLIDGDFEARMRLADALRLRRWIVETAPNAELGLRHLEDAQRYIAEHRYGASMAVRSPDGTWEVIAPRARHYSSRRIQKLRRTG
jgi:hypothetical protein